MLKVGVAACGNSLLFQLRRRLCIRWAEHAAAMGRSLFQSCENSLTREWKQVIPLWFVFRGLHSAQQSQLRSEDAIQRRGNQIEVRSPKVVMFSQGRGLDRIESRQTNNDAVAGMGCASDERARFKETEAQAMLQFGKALREWCDAQGYRSFCSAIFTS